MYTIHIAEQIMAYLVQLTYMHVSLYVTTSLLLRF